MDRTPSSIDPVIPVIAARLAELEALVEAQRADLEVQRAALGGADPAFTRRSG